MENYFNYFTEIEEHFQARRGAGLLLSTLDWALIETWKDAGIPLEAVLRGIDDAFDNYDKKPSKTRKVNSLAYCSQAVLTAAEELKEASAGSVPTAQYSSGKAPTGFEPQEISKFLRRNTEALKLAKVPAETNDLVQSTIQTLGKLADALTQERPNVEDLERHLTILEEKLQASLLSRASDLDLLAIRREADRDLAPYRSNLPAAQIDQLHKQYVNKKLLERCNLPRLSLFYM